MSNKKNFRANFVAIIVSFILTIFLFIYVTNQRSSSSSTSDNSKQEQMSATKVTTLNVPLQLNANTDKYFITGYPQKVSIRLEGPTALVTATANTLNFRVVADLTNKGVGVHKVMLKGQGINKSINYRITPKYINASIQVRKNRKMAIQLDYNKENIAPGYEAGQAVMSQDAAEVTSAKSELEKINQIVAKVNLQNNTKTTFERDVLIQPLDTKGNTVNAVVNPEVVHIKLPIVKQPSKKVKIKFTQDGDGVSGKEYSFKSSTNEITIYGEKSVINRIDTLAIPVVVADVNKDVERIIELPIRDGISKYSSSSVSVKIIVKDKK